MLDHEPRGGPEAMWSRLRSSAVACHEEEVGVLGGRNHLGCDASSQRLRTGIMTELRLRFGQQLLLRFR